MAATTRQKVGWGTANIIVILLALIPILWIVSLSFKDPATITDAIVLAEEVDLGELLRASSRRRSSPGRSSTRSASRSISTFIAVLFASMAAYAVARLDFPGKGAAHRHVPAHRDVPGRSRWSRRCSTSSGTSGCSTPGPGSIIPYITFGLPLAIYTLSAFFREIPWELEKAAKMDGATPFQAFTKVIAPLAAPGMFTTAILVFILCWNDFLFAISLTSTTRARTVPAAIGFFTGSSQFTAPTGSIAAAAVIITIPIIIFVLLFQRRIVAGLTSGAVKG